MSQTIYPKSFLIIQIVILFDFLRIKFSILKYYQF